MISKVNILSKLKYWIPGLVVLLLGVFVLSRFSEPPAPKKLTLLTGPAKGAYYKFGLQYASYMRQNGVEVDVVVTRGSVENSARIASGGGAVIGFVQGGTVNAAAQPDLVSLGSLYYEPLWVFYRGEQDLLEDLRHLRGKRIAIGPVGSGTRAVAIELLRENGLCDGDGKGSSGTRLLTLSSEAAVAALTSEDPAQRVDAAFFILGCRAPMLSRLIAGKGVRLMNFRRHLSYRQRIRFLSTVHLHQGMLDLGRNLPAEDATLMAPAATLMAHKQVHPGIAELLTQASLEIFRKGDILEKPREFPAIDHLGDVPMNETAERVIVDGPSLLSRYLPFWAVSLIRRLRLLLIGLIPVLLIAGKAAPALYKWRMDRRVYSWYEQLRKIEQSIEVVGASISLERIRQLQSEVRNVKVPTTYWKEMYNLRQHITLVAREIDAREVG